MKLELSIVDLNSDGEEQHDMISSPEIDTFRSQFHIKTIANLECRVCGGPAHGYNFNQISCESCKAFFRRNALRHIPQMKCRFIGKCKITVESRRQCTYCRLKKCFDVKMKKEWIRTDEERYLRILKRLYKQPKKMDKQINISIVQRKKNRLNFLPYLSNQYKQPIFRMNPSFSSSGNLTIDDWSLINNITHAYNNWALDCDTTHIKNYSLSNTSLTDFLNDEQQMYRSLIQFYKQIPQFKEINLEDQILLIKCNVTHLIHIHHILKDEFIENDQIGLHMSKWISSDFHQRMSKTRQSFNSFIQHPVILKITLVAFMFIVNLSRLPNDQLSFEITDKHLLREHQNLFITLLWKYLNVIYDEKNAIRAMQFLVFQFLRYQLLMNEMETILTKQNNSSQFHPLTKSVLRLT